jgi:hypothetical protein
MTLDQFNKHRWAANTRGEYGGVVYLIVAVDFAECLIGLRNPLDDNEIAWVRCENVNLRE